MRREGSKDVLRYFCFFPLKNGVVNEEDSCISSGGKERKKGRIVKWVEKDYISDSCTEPIWMDGCCNWML